MHFATRLQNVETSAIRELFKLLGQPGIISFAGGFPDPALFDAEGIAQSSAAVLQANPGPVLQYGATEGWGPARQAIAAHMAEKGCTVAPEGLIVTTGSQQALDLIGKCLISPGDKVIVEAPTFLATIQCFRLYGADIVNAPIDADGVDVDRLEALIAQHKPKLVYLIPTFGNPSGATLNQARRKRVLEVAARTRTLIVEDDPYGQLYFDQPPPPSLLALSDRVPGSRDWLVHCGSFSKILSPGLRVGWMIAPAELLAKATMCKQFSDAHTSNLSQAIAAHYLGTGRMRAALERVRQVYAERAHAMATALRRELGDAIAFEAPKGGMFFWARLTGARGRESSAAQLAQRALAAKVAFVPGAPFYAHDPDPATLRLSFVTVDLPRIDEGVARLASVV
ncbi:MAG: PLP-dependent aminotransferase family protein [Rhodoferax sp.]